MEATTLAALTASAAFVGFLHTLTGPDHYLPFLAMARAGQWTLPKTLVVTLVCGIGHVLSSVMLGMLGISLGMAVTGLACFEGMRGSLAGWLLLGFGLAYTAWGIRRAIRKRAHVHLHVHADGNAHEHTHVHTRDHTHVHTDGERARSVTPWILFTIFVFGPCEPLVPILMYPAAKMGLWGVALVALVFSLATLVTMTTIVAVGCLGLAQMSFVHLRRYGHAMAGLVVTACGLAVKIGL